MQGERYRKITPVDVARVHADHRTWLEAQLAESFAGRTVVVTHHAPLDDCVPRMHDVAEAYASDLSGLIDTYQPDEWLYGHTHHPCALRRGRTEIRCVSIGYPHEVETSIPPVLAAFGV